MKLLTFPKLGKSGHGTGGLDAPGISFVISAWQVYGMMLSIVINFVSQLAVWRRVVRICLTYGSGQSCVTNRRRYAEAFLIGFGVKKSCA